MIFYFLICTFYLLVKTRLRFTFQLVNESSGLIEPFEALFGSESMKFGVAVEIDRRAMGERHFKSLGWGLFSFRPFHRLAEASRVA